MDDDELISELNRKAKAAESQAQQLLRKAEAYRNAASELSGDSPVILAKSEPAKTEAAKHRREQDAPTNGAYPPSWATPRMLEIDAFLRTHGPATKGEIASGSGVPAGTLRAVLNRGNFERDEAGQRWIRLRHEPQSEN